MFWLSFVDDAQQRAVVREVSEACAKTARGRAALDRLAPALSGLRAAIDGQRFDADGKLPTGGRRLLGWSCGPHWLTESS